MAQRGAFRSKQTQWAADQGSTTGTTPSGEFVGRVAGQDVGSAGEQGSERRAAWEQAQKT